MHPASLAGCCVLRASCDGIREQRVIDRERMLVAEHALVHSVGAADASRSVAISCRAASGAGSHRT